MVSRICCLNCVANILGQHILGAVYETFVSNFGQHNIERHEELLSVIIRTLQPFQWLREWKLSPSRQCADYVVEMSDYSSRMYFDAFVG